MSEEHIRQSIDEMLAKLDVERMKRVYFLLRGMLGRVSL